MRKLNTLLLLALSISGLVSAQTISINQSPGIPDGEGDVFIPAPDTYVAVTSKRPKVTAYTRTMQTKYSHYIDEFADSKYIGAIQYNRKLYLFSNHKKDISLLAFDVMKGEVIGKLTPVFSITNNNNVGDFYKGISPDGSYSFAVFGSGKKSNQDFVGVIMDNKMDVITKFSFQLEDMSDYIDNTTFIISPEGSLYAINKIRVKAEKKDYRPFQYLITEVNQQGQTVTTLVDDFPTGRLSNIVWTNSKSGLSFTGLLAKTKKEDFQYIVSGEFSSWSKKVTGLKEIAIGSAAFWPQASGEFLLKVKEKGVAADAEMVKHFILSDGTILMVLQPIETGLQTSHYVMPGHSVNTTRVKSVYILKIKKELELEWMQAIPMAQHELNYKVYCGVLPILQNNKELYIFFHDYTRYTGPQPEQRPNEIGLGSSWPSIQLTSFHVNEKGALNRIKITNYIPDDMHRFSPHFANATGEGIGVFTLHHRPSGALGGHSFPLGSKGSFKLASFTIQ
jgi:hypothetical protein